MKKLWIGLSIVVVLVVLFGVWFTRPPEPLYILDILVEVPQAATTDSVMQATFPLPHEVAEVNPVEMLEEVIPPPKTPREIRRLQGHEALLQGAPLNVQEYVLRNGIPPVALDKKDPYYLVTFLKPDGNGKRTRRAASVHPVTNDFGETNAYAIQYLKGQVPVVVSNDGNILVSEIVQPGGAE